MSRHRSVGVDWVLHPLELTMLLTRFGRDRLPYPLHHRSDAATGREYFEQRDAADRRVEQILNDELETATNILVSPSYRVEMMGERADGTVLRSLTAVRGNTAVALIQDPGAVVRLRHCGVRDAIQHGLTPLPDVGPGRERPISLQRTSNRGSLLDCVDVESPSVRFDRMFSRTRSAAGAVTIAPGSSVDNRPEDGAVGFFWIDFAGDGRYLVHSSDTVEAHPASIADLVEEIGRLARCVEAGSA